METPVSALSSQVNSLITRTQTQTHHPYTIHKHDLLKKKKKMKDYRGLAIIHKRNLSESYKVKQDKLRD